MENSVLCDIQAVSICNSEYYKNIKRRFISEFDDSENQLPEQPPIPKGPVLDAASDGAKYSMMSAMALLKGAIEWQMIK